MMMSRSRLLMRRRQRMVALFAATAIAALVGFESGATAAAPPAVVQPSTLATLQSGAPTAADLLAEQTQDAYEQDPGFGGVSYDAGSDIIALRVVKGSSADKYIPLGSSAAFRVTYVDRSYGRLLGITDALANEQARLAFLGLSLESRGPDLVNNRVEIRSSAMGAQGIEALSREFQGAVVVVPGTRWLSADRLSDGYPYKGGDYVVGLNGGVTMACTSGYGVTGSNGSKYLLTAGHCFDSNETASHNNASIGQVTNRNPYNAGGTARQDVELIKTGSAASILTDGNNAFGVRGAYNPVIGDAVCKSGITTDLTCGAKVFRRDLDVSYDGRTFWHQSQVGEHAGDPADFADHGDSGGPVFRFNNGVVDVAGSVGAVGGARGPAGHFAGMSFQSSSAALGAVSASINHI